jgi:predicted transcriptional regulator
MFKDTTELAENKLLLLYIFDKIAMPISNSYITQIILENNLINYFSLQQYLSELAESGFIEDIKEDKRHLLAITSLGKDTLQFFINRIPEKKMQLIDAYLNLHMNSIKKDIEVVSEYEPCVDNKFMVTLKLKSGDNTLIELKVPADSNAKAKSICQTWKEKNQEIYDKIINYFDIENKK